MAVTVTTPLALSLNTFGTDVISEWQAVASDGTNNVASIDCSTYSKVLILIKNAHADTAKDAWILKGNGVGQPASDLACLDITAASATIMPVIVETSKYMNWSGTYKNKIVVKGESTDIQVAVIGLPQL